MSSVIVEWNSRTDPAVPSAVNLTFATSGNHAWPVPGDILFPEKSTPTATTVDNRLGFILDVFPKVNRALTAPLYLYITDPDNALSNTHAILVHQKFDINDTFANGANTPVANDNMDSVVSYQVPRTEVPGAKFVESGDRRLTVTVEDAVVTPGGPSVIGSHGGCL